MSGIIASTLLPVAAQTAGNIVTGLVSGRMSYKKSLKLADYAYSKDLEMWNRQNEYNTPQAQMERLTQAGLNPNMIYGTGVSGSTGQAKEMPRYNAPTAKYDIQMPNLIGTLSAFQDIKVKQAQVDNIKAQTDARLIQNNINRETVLDQVRKLRASATTEEMKASIDSIKASIENMLFYDDNGSVQFGARKAELSRSQSDADKAQSEATLKRIELSIYDMLKNVSKDSDTAKFLNKVLNMLFIKM